MTTCQFDVLYILLKYFRFSIAITRITIYNDIETTSGIDFFYYILSRACILHIFNINSLFYSRARILFI